MEPIEINRPVLNRRITFETADEVLKFLEEELEFWQWLETEKIHSSVKQLVSGYQPSWVGAMQVTARAIKDNPNDPSFVETLKGQLGQRFQNRYEWCSRDPESLQIKEIAKQDPEAAAMALCVLAGRDHQIQDASFETRHSFRVGRAKGSAILAGVDPKTLEAVKSSADAIKDGVLRDADAVRDVLSNTQTHTRETMRQIQEDAHSQHLTIAEGYEQALKAQQEAFNKLKGELEGITAAYAGQMQLQGPVQYWEDRAEKYRNAAWTLGIFSLVSAVALFCLYSFVASHLTAAGGAIPYAALFKSTAFALLMTTIFFWAGRILLRIYLGLYHLASDADERRTMIMTFLAMLKGQSVEEKDRAVVLSALFRPGSDGIVKDDAAPEVGALIQSLLRRP